ncbi:MAG: aminopeptidase [Chloroflexi bacterium]|nr:aminopeptidase [Chloroflexota bacterium]
MQNQWAELGRRLALGVQAGPGDLVLVRDVAGSPELLLETVLALELRGAVALPYLMSAAKMEQMLAAGNPALITAHGAGWTQLLQRIDRVLVLGGVPPKLDHAPPAARAALDALDTQWSAVEETRRLPYLVAAIPTAAQADRLHLEHEALLAHLMPALLAPVEELRAEIGRILAVAGVAERLTIRTGEDHELRMIRRGRPWLADDGVIDAGDQASGAIVSNLPAASLYTTIVEASAEGSVALERAGSAHGVVFQFRDGRIVAIEAEAGANELAAFLDSHNGEPRRISHIGIGLNPYLRLPIGWPLVDEHVHGALFLALGENRYMGGDNRSSLNIDFVLGNATLRADGLTLVEHSQVMV